MPVKPVRGVGAMLRLDFALAYRNGLVLVAAVLSALFIVLVDFVVPKQVSLAAKEYLVDLTWESTVAGYVRDAGGNAIILGSEEELLSRMRTEKTAVGIVFKDGQRGPEAIVFFQGNEPPGLRKALEAALPGLWDLATGTGGPSYYKVESLRPEVEKPPFNKAMVPAILATEVMMLGYLFTAVMVFQEKAEGSLKAYRISPGRTWMYVCSKVLSNALLTVAYGTALLAFTVGLGHETFEVAGLVFVAGILLSSVGLAVSVFFDDLSGFLYPGISLFLVVGLGVVTYFFPPLIVPGLNLIPSYPLAFGVREILFPTGKTGFYLPTMMTLALEAILALAACYLAVDSRLMKEGH